MTDAVPAGEQPPILLPHPLRWPAWISLGVLLVIFIGLLKSPVPVYHTIMVALVLPLVLRHHRSLARRLQAIRLPALLRFILLGFLAVLAEEALVGTIAGLWQGGGSGHVLRKIQQFQLLNLFAFTGLILGLGLMRVTLLTGPWDLWLIAGGWGLFAEKVYLHVVNFPVAGIALVLPTTAVYALIMAPAWLSAAPEERGRRAVPLALRVPLAWAVIFALSLPPILTLEAWRTAEPGLFPDCSEIGCGQPAPAE